MSESKEKPSEINEEVLERAIRKVHKLILSKIKKFEHELSLFNDPYQKYKIIQESKDFLSKKLRQITTKIEHKFDHLEELEREIVNTYIRDLRKMPSILKRNIRKIEDKNFRKALSNHLKVIKEKELLIAIESGLISWEKLLDTKYRFGEGMDERVIEVPLAIEVGSFSQPGKVLDAGAALNAKYIRDYIGRPEAYIVHFTQSAQKEEVMPLDDRVSYIFGDLRDMDFKDEVFDRIICISTLEHIGMDNTRYGGQKENNPNSYLNAVREMFRVLKRGGRLLFTFPYGKPMNFGWYRIFGRSDIEHIIEICSGCEFKEKYFYYNGFWYEATAAPPVNGTYNDEEDIEGVAAILIIKN
ncbi:class I SAM-dependent methyltransferase [Thermosulfuriphilus ammonigenes]|uniref:Class I SAM-dependent methyltransferase n=1 Tax=Thermosulfuriphilus ammonigenes TaxID=1936021 RepID=A0A6G7PXT0_9BACT|nr:methyltransferase domain-containing protein [Thermosulfuriphilus ammonigenes]MBA2849537.1 SAM-dependent methyltransferase [Thermosulfuriphilus ammonigenes]QIJ72356.1 class I SAM-dependent methyltransferase [Thermosulfuriphilus ammonigenes]